MILCSGRLNGSKAVGNDYLVQTVIFGFWIMSQQSHLTLLTLDAYGPGRRDSSLLHSEAYYVPTWTTRLANHDKLVVGVVSQSVR